MELGPAVGARLNTQDLAGPVLSQDRIPHGARHDARQRATQRDVSLLPYAEQIDPARVATATPPTRLESETFEWGGIGGFGSGLGAQVVLSGAPERPPPEVNVSAVIENPRESRPSLLSEFLHHGIFAPPAPMPMSLIPLPEISRRDFADYISQLRVARSRAGLSAADVVLRDDDSAAFDADSSSTTDGQMASGGSTLTARRRSASALSPSHLLTLSRLSSTSSGGSDRTVLIAGSVFLDAFQIVPAQFFEPAYDIGVASTFAALLAEAGIRRGDGSTAASSACLASLDETQERLTAYLDIVECQLLALIKSRSRQFFGALSDFQELQHRVEAAHDTAKQLAVRVARIKTEASVQPLYVVHATRRRHRGAALRDSLATMLRARRDTLSISGLIGAGRLGTALDVICATRTLIAERLPRVTAVTGMQRQLREYERLVADTFVANFIRDATTAAIVGTSEHDEARTSAVANGVGVEADRAAPLQYASDGGSRGLSSSAVGLVTHVQHYQRLSDAAIEATRIAVEGLVRTNRLSGALEGFQAALVRELKQLVRSEVAEAVVAAEQTMLSPSRMESGATIVAEAFQTSSVSTAALSMRADASSAAPDVTPERLTALTPASFLRVLASLCASLLDALRRVHAIEELVENVLDAHATHPPQPQAVSIGGNLHLKDSTDDAFQNGDWTVTVSRLRAQSSAVVAVAVDASLRHVGRLLSLRRDAGARARITDVKALWVAGAAFSSATSALLAHAGGTSSTFTSSHHLGPSTGVGGSITTAANPSPVLDECLATARALLLYQHGRNMPLLVAMLDAETWRQVDVPPAVQALVEAISASGRGGGSARWGASASASASVGAPSRAGGGVHGAATTSLVQAAAAVSDVLVSHPATSGAPIDPVTAPTAASVASGVPLLVRGVKFPVVGTAVMLLKMLGDYASLAEALPDVAGDVIRSTVELLRTFNSRTTQLVLMAGAMQTAQLKRITAKHLALAVQSLGAVLALLPSVRAALIMRLPPAQTPLLADMARVTADFMTHESAILAKFVEIVKELLVHCVEEMRNIPWGDSETTITVPTAPMRELCRGISTLHKILAPVLRPEQLADVFTRIAAMTGAQAPLQYSALLAHLTDTALRPPPSSAAALDLKTGIETSSTATSRPYPAPAAAFSRSIVNERLAADIRIFTATLRGVLLATESGGDAELPNEGAIDSAAQESSEPYDAAAASSAGMASVASLTQWASRQFGVGSIVADPQAVAATDATAAKSASEVEGVTAATAPGAELSDEVSPAAAAATDDDGDDDMELAAALTNGVQTDSLAVAETATGYSQSHHAPRQLMERSTETHARLQSDAAPMESVEPLATTEPRAPQQEVFASLPP